MRVLRFAWCFDLMFVAYTVCCLSCNLFVVFWCFACFAWFCLIIWLDCVTYVLLLWLIVFVIALVVLVCFGMVTLVADLFVFGLGFLFSCLLMCLFLIFGYCIWLLCCLAYLLWFVGVFVVIQVVCVWVLTCFYLCLWLICCG